MHIYTHPWSFSAWRCSSVNRLLGWFPKSKRAARENTWWWLVVVIVVGSGFGLGLIGVGMRHRNEQQ